MNASSFSIQVHPSPDSNDHQVRFLVDGHDLIARYWSDMLGVDPDEILREPCPLLPADRPRRVVVARCVCGVVGCGDETISLAARGEAVEWTLLHAPGKGSPVIRFPVAQYEAEVRRALHDTSWETPDRTAARLVRRQLVAAPIPWNGFHLEWASGRARAGFFTVSFMLDPGPYQVLVHLPYAAESPDIVAREMLAELSREPSQWQDVEWSPLAGSLGTPPGAGSAWRRLTRS